MLSGMAVPTAAKSEPVTPSEIPRRSPRCSSAFVKTSAATRISSSITTRLSATPIGHPRSRRAARRRDISSSPTWYHPFFLTDSLIAMDFFLKALLLGIVEGLTEFLPISSTGHLIIAADLLDYTGEKAKTFEVIIQLGAILAVCWLYRARLAFVALGLHREPEARRFAFNIGIAFLPAAALGFLLHGYIKTYLFTPVVVACALIGGGVAILAIERLVGKPRVDDVDAIGWKQALQVGSRSGRCAHPRRLALGRDHHGRARIRPVATRGDGILLLPRDTDHVRGHRLRPVREPAPVERG